MKTFAIIFMLFISNLCFGQQSNWSTYFGGNSGEICYGSVCDKHNNIIIYGSTDSNSNLPTSGAHQVTYGGNGDGFVAKFAPSGNLLWATYYGGSGGDEIFSACIDNNDNILITGITGSLTNISTPGSFQEIGTGGSFIAKFNSNGVRLWGSYFNNGFIRDVCNDNLNNVVFCGYTSSLSGVSTIGTHHTLLAGSYDGFIEKFNSNGNRLWGTYYGGSNDDDCFSCTADNSNNIIITGRTASDTGIATSGASQINLNGVEDAYIAKFKSSGNILWSTYCGGSDYEDAYSVCADKNNNVIVGGSSISMNGIATPGAYKILPDGQDAFVVKYDSNGLKKWGTYYGGPDGMDPDRLNRITTNNNGEIFIVGNTNATSGIATIGSYCSSYLGNIDGYFAKFSSSGSFMWGSYFGGKNDDNVLGISIDSFNLIVIAGNSFSDSNIATSGAYDTVLNGISDAFLACFDSTGHISAIPTINNATKNSLLQVYPNPAKDKITVSIKDYAGNKGGSLMLMNVEGKVAKSAVVKSAECSLDVKDLSAGVYLLQYDDGEVCETVKVMKE